MTSRVTTHLLIGYDGSESARAAITVAAALFPGAEAVVATVHPPPPTVESGALARIALPDSMIVEGVERMRAEADRTARATVTEGTELAAAAGLRASPLVAGAVSVWRALRQHARDAQADVLVCGTRGEGPIDRIVIGSTASSLLHHADRPLLVVPAAAAAGPDATVVAGFDGSEGARRALRFAAAQLREHPLVVVHAWRSSVRHSLRGHALAQSRIGKLEDFAAALDEISSTNAEESANEGVAYARELGLRAQPSTPESGDGEWQAVMRGARDAGAGAILVGSRGRGAVASTVLGSVASGLVHDASLPVLGVPPGEPDEPPPAPAPAE
jgi:nucleotide-binding universal stress UspA family protein